MYVCTKLFVVEVVFRNINEFVSTARYSYQTKELNIVCRVTFRMWLKKCVCAFPVDSILLLVQQLLCLWPLSIRDLANVRFK